MTALQELIDQAAVRVAPPKAGEPRAPRVLIPVSRLAAFEKDLDDIARHYDGTESFHVLRRVRQAWERFKGNGGRS